MSFDPVLFEIVGSGVAAVLGVAYTLYLIRKGRR